MFDKTHIGRDTRAAEVHTAGAEFEVAPSAVAHFAGGRRHMCGATLTEAAPYRPLTEGRGLKGNRV